uniref:(northern house mosquito) hypothetical protein n=1 Tax=Culex pipiens TaxID=7175 RepID=A0A8D8N0T0_CULPI
MSLLNHSVLFFFFSPHSPIVLEVTSSSCSQPTSPSCSDRWRLSTVGWRPGKKEKATHEVRVAFLFLRPSRVSTAPLSCVLKAHDVTVARLPIFPHPNFHTVISQ